MTNSTQDMFLAAAKAQLDAGFRLFEAIAEGARSICEAQLDAAVEAHACAEATRKQLAQAREPQEIWRIQSEYLSGCLRDWVAHCDCLRERAVEAQANVSRCLGQPGAGPAGASGGGPFIDMMDSAYKRWLETTRQFYGAPLVARPQVRAE
jgi:hypothetical protein